MERFRSAFCLRRGAVGTATVENLAPDSLAGPALALFDTLTPAVELSAYGSDDARPYIAFAEEIIAPSAS